MQSGGRLLGQGVFGCTFEPAPRCAGGKVFKKIGDLPAVGKITSEDSAAELAIGKAIMALPLASSYFALPSAGCSPSLPINDPDVKDCSVITESGEGTKFSMLIMPTAGEQLIKYVANTSRLAANYKRIFIHLLEGAVIYQGAGYVHNDIHMGNVLVDDKGVARYIDFGLAFNVSDVKVWEDSNLGTQFRPKYIWQAPEVHAWRMVLNGVRVAEGVRQLREINQEYKLMEHQFPTRKPALTALADLLTTSKLVAKRDGGAFVREYGKRFDSWRIGLCMWFLWNDMLHWQPFVKTQAYEERELFRKVLGGMTDFDPRTRFTVGEALRLMDPKNRLVATP
jgi:hypothetical protein